MSQSELFAQQVHWPAPSVPSPTSEQAAARLDATGTRQREVARVLRWFGQQSVPRTRHELAAALYPNVGGIGSACGRVDDLRTLGLLEEVGRQGKRATLALTEKGRGSVR